MAAATLYSYVDASAPQFSGTSATGADLITILKACLINGYGTRTPVGGWTIAFEDAANQTIVFKHATENQYIRIDDGISYQWAAVRAYTGMTDVNTGTGQYPPDSYITPSNYIVGKRWTSSVNQWHVIVFNDGSGFYFFSHDDLRPAGFFFGKLEHPTEAARRWMITGKRGTSFTSNNYQNSWSTAGSEFFADKDRYDSGNPERVDADTFYTTSFTQPSPLDGKLFLQKVFIESYSAPQVFFGYYPNMYSGLGSINSLFTDGNIVTIDGVQYLFLGFGVGYLIKVTSTS